MKYHVLVIAACLLVASCGSGTSQKGGTEPPPKPKPTIVRTGDIVRILMHTNEDFTILVQPKGSKIIYQQDIQGDNVTYVADVSPDKKMWALTTRAAEDSEFWTPETLVFHIHSVDDLNAAGWTGVHGYRGQNHVIE